MILSAQTIREYAMKQCMIMPFNERVVHEGMTFGLGPAGYDCRLDLSPFGYNECTVWPGEAHLFSVLERIELPNHIQGEIKDKSSLARKFIVLQNTVLEPGWYGYPTIELTHHGKEAIRLVHGMPICQIKFTLLDFPTELPYNGKYQDQPARPVDAIWES